jgi:putative transposase
MNYQSIKDDTTLMNKLIELSEDHPREGFWKHYNRLRNDGHKINHKRVHRVYKELGLPLRRKVKKRLPSRSKEKIQIPTKFNHTWSIDFMSDALSNGRKIRSFNAIDDYNREILFIEVDYSIKSSRVLWVLRHLVAKHGKPERIRMDNGPEFVANLAQQWSEFYQIEFKYIQPGKPTQNALIKRFNRTYRDGVLDRYLFDSIDEVCYETSKWTEDYNQNRPHDSLGGLSPIAYKEAQKNLEFRSATLHFTQDSLIDENCLL